MTTGTAVKASLPAAVNATDAEVLAALHVAIAESWPRKKMHGYDANAATLAGGTWEYELVLSPAPSREYGIARVYIDGNPLDRPPTLRRRVRQRYDETTGNWTLIFSPDLVSAYAGKNVGVEYQYPHPAITALTDTIDLPLGYLTAYVTFHLAQMRLSEQPHDARFWRDIMLLNEERMAMALRPHDKGLSPLSLVRDAL